MLTGIYNACGLAMTIWYVVGYRWTLQGNELGKWVVKTSVGGKSLSIGNGFVLNWWFAPFNMTTAFLSAYFVVRAFFFLDKSFTESMMYIASFLFIRNMYYAIEDITDYLANPSKKQGMFVLVDLVMALFVALWILKLKAIF
jgi:hypothetical protein